MEERKRIRPERGEWPYVVLAIVVFFGSIFLFVAELDNFGLTTSLNTFLILFGIIGLLIAIYLSYVYGKGTKGVERVKLTMLFLVFVTLSVPIWAHFLNHLITLNTKTESVEVFENSLEGVDKTDRLISSVKENGFDLFLVYKRKVISIKTKTEEYIHLKANDRIDITLHTGLFGFEYIDVQ